MDPQSHYGRRAINVGLNPLTTSILGLCCVENGLPHESSFIALAAKKAGLKDISIDEAKRLFGEDWTHKICR